MKIPFPYDCNKYTKNAFNVGYCLINVTKNNISTRLNAVGLKTSK